MGKEGILELLKKRPVVGDGGYVMALERRGYVTAGPFSTEVIVENPDAVQQLHKEFLRAGADVLQAFTFYTTEGRLQYSDATKSYSSDEVNQKACDIVRPVAESGNALICGGISPTPTYDNGKGDKDKVRAEFRKQCDIFVKNNFDFLLAEFIGHVEEAELALEECKKTGLPVAITLRIGPEGDLDGVSPGDCAVRLAKKGAEIVGVNCQYDINTCLKTIKLMKDALEKEDLNPFLMVQPIGFLAPEVETHENGYHALPEYPIALEPRIITRAEVHMFVRKAYELGVRYFGGCCGFEAYHIRAISEELAEERGFRLPGKSNSMPWGGGMKASMFTYNQKKTTKNYWTSFTPVSTREGRTANLSYLKE